MTGNLVSGHKRLEILDALEKSQDYSLTVAKVRLTLEEEKAQNSFFNSTTAQGAFDFDKLLDLFRDGMDPFDAGFDQNDLNIIGYDFTANSMVSEEQSEAEAEIEQMYSPPKEEKAAPFSKEEIKAAKQKILDGAAERMDEGEKYITIVFPSYKDKADFMTKIGFQPEDVFIDSSLFIPHIK